MGASSPARRVFVESIRCRGFTSSSRRWPMVRRICSRRRASSSTDGRLTELPTLLYPPRRVATHGERGVGQLAPNAGGHGLFHSLAVAGCEISPPRPCSGSSWRPTSRCRPCTESRGRSHGRRAPPRRPPFFAGLAALSTWAVSALTGSPRGAPVGVGQAVERRAEVRGHSHRVLVVSFGFTITHCLASHCSRQRPRRRPESRLASSSGVSSLATAPRARSCRGSAK